MVDVKRLPIAASVEDEAAAWVARRDTGPLDAEAAAEFDAWLATSPAHGEAFRRYSELWDEFDGLASRPAVREAANDRPGWLARRAVAAGIGLMLLAGVTYSALDRTSAPRLATAVGEQRSVTLADGSRVTLNTGTELVADLGEGSRRIRLAQGEALFEVAHDPDRPFIVESPYGTVRAVGTKFVVRVDEGRRLSVLVTEGKVIVARKDEGAGGKASAGTPLGAGQELEAVGGKVEVARLDSDRLMRELAWRRGDVVFEGESLAEAVAEMQRYTERRIVVDPKVAHYSVGGYFRTNDIDAFVGTLETVFPVRAERSGQVIRLTARS